MTDTRISVRITRTASMQNESRPAWPGDFRLLPHNIGWVDRQVAIGRVWRRDRRRGENRWQRSRRRRGRKRARDPRAGSQRMPERGGEDIEVGRVDLAGGVVAEVALREGAAAGAEVAGEDVEVRR